MDNKNRLSVHEEPAESKEVFLKIKKIVLSKPFIYILPLISLWSYFATQIKTIHSPTGYYLIHYLYTYDKGFVARGLVGETISLFKDKIGSEDIRKVMIIFAFLLVTAASLCISRAVTKCRSDGFRLGFVLVLITVICINSYSISYYMADDKLDKIVWALTLFAVFLSCSKKTVWIAPVLCIAATLVNPVFLFSSNILISIILLSQFRENNYSKYYGFICLFSYTVMLAIGIYGSFSDTKLGFENEQELIDFYFSRYTDEIPRRTIDEFLTEWIFDYFNTPLESYKLAYKYYFVGWGFGAHTIKDTIISAIPFFTAAGIFWAKVMKNEKDRFRKFIYFLCMIAPVATIPPVLVSWEGSKYYSSIAIVQLCLAVYFICRNDEAFMKTLRSFCSYVRNHFAVMLAVSFYFALMVMVN